MAKFEVCCHRFADLSEANYGVSILNDSKYGFATCGNLMRLSLLRSPKAPDAHADMGHHTIGWAILPHKGALGSSTVRAAYQFNNPLHAVEAPATGLVSALSAMEPPVYIVGDESLMVDCVKRGEDDEDVSVGALPVREGRSVVVRIYESLGGHSRGTVKMAWKIKKVHKTNILEDDLSEVEAEKSSFDVSLRPFEVATYHVEV